MAYKIIWSPEAEESFENIIHYLAKRFTDKEVKSFVSLVNRRVLFLQHTPGSFRKTAKSSKRRRTVIHKRTILFYTINERKKEVELLYFFDTRRFMRGLKD